MFDAIKSNMMRDRDEIYNTNICKRYKLIAKIEYMNTCS